ncbi:hypothetical protein F5J12DRAFT_726460, partial [Pisolithus orientalis]|uniref:uncharacterized protein n=1 Tax=Pisolithus orientalis TaxID=936130 RepID=UPI002225112C
KIEEAIEYGYKPCNYSSDAYDLALLVYCLGGANLLYVLNHRLGLLSLHSVVHNHFSPVTITPVIGTITLNVVVKNIHGVVVEPHIAAGCTALHGVSLLTDEVALEECAVYFPSANVAGSLCWKHGHTVDPVLNTYESAMHIAKKLTSGEVHLGKEMTVIIAHCFGEDQTYPILAAPSCKEEDYNDWEKVIENVIDAWYSNDAQKLVGPPWSFVTDGDSTRQKAGHKIFMKSKLDESSPLYGILSGLPGLNLQTGPHDMMLDFDYKHIIKHDHLTLVPGFCTMLCSVHGVMLNNGCHINAKFLLRYLTWLEDCDNVKAQKLLYPDDPQDVPCAVELIKAITQLGQINPTQAPYAQPGYPPDVNAIMDFEVLSMLGNLLHHLLEPFTNTMLSLTEQVMHLSAFAHLLFALYHAHQCAFMPDQLYYDTQTMVKNAIFCIAKQQQLDASFPFYLPDVGDDAIELLFAFLWMCGGHNSAINYKQAIDHLCAVRDVGSIYACNLDLSHGHHRLNFSHSEHVNHINHQMWNGDLTSHNCNLPSAWTHGHAIALGLLTDSTLDPDDYAFDTLFTNSDVDLLSVFGHRRYPGINDDGDDIDGDDPSSITPAPTTTTTIERSNPCEAQIEVDLEEVHGDEVEEAEEVSEDVPSFEDKLEDEIGDPTLLVKNGDSSLLSPPSGPGIWPLDYLFVNSKYVHKSMVCCVLFNGNFTPKSHDHLLRVRGYTAVNKPMESVSLLSDSTAACASFIVGNPYLTLIHFHDNATHLALLRSTAIHENGISRSDINFDTLLSVAGKVKITGEILTLLVSPLTPDDDCFWIWNGVYLKASSPLPGSNVSTQKVVEMTTLGALIHLVNPSIVTAANYLPSEHLAEVNSHGITWAISNNTLEVAVNVLWKWIVDSKLAVSNITLMQISNLSFLYSMNGEIIQEYYIPVLKYFQAVQHCLVKKQESHCVLVVGMPTADLCSHMGTHILRASRGVGETDLYSAVGQLFPCGFCGCSGHSDCVVKLKSTKHTKEIDTCCIYQIPFKYGFGERGSTACPCHNVPVVCPLCVHHGRDTEFRDAVWHYNMEQHLGFFHPEYAHPGKVMGHHLPHHVFDILYIMPAKEKKAGVPARPAFTLIAEKENYRDLAVSTGQKRKGNSTRAVAAGGSCLSRGKRART